MPAAALPPHLRGRRHEDWPWPFSRIPRAWTAWKWGMPEKVFGEILDADDDFVWRWGAPLGPKPITSPGT